ncbi:hypothetical protein ABZ461_10880 [Actinacidiphila glaucinigra]|uniref:hypothetical protein n=1 Tax=Actinacidiphila glaucinigra TaxID=235986 RepID=UPI003404CB21
MTHPTRGRPAHSADRWALACLLGGVPPAESLRAPFVWQPGWTYTLPGDWPGPGGGPAGP